jgi:hypothetical protein
VTSSAGANRDRPLQVRSARASRAARSSPNTRGTHRSFPGRRRANSTPSARRSPSATCSSYRRRTRGTAVSRRAVASGAGHTHARDGAERRRRGRLARHYQRPVLRWDGPASEERIDLNAAAFNEHLDPVPALRTQPPRPYCVARRCTNGRKPTPWTTPSTTCRAARSIITSGPSSTRHQATRTRYPTRRVVRSLRAPRVRARGEPVR